MNAMKAMEQTVKFAFDRGMKTGGCLGYDHIAGMVIKMQSGNFSYGKQCRWLGWMQAAVVAAGCADLEDMKAINKLNSADEVAKCPSIYDVEIEQFRLVTQAD